MPGLLLRSGPNAFLLNAGCGVHLTRWTEEDLALLNLMRNAPLRLRPNTARERGRRCPHCGTADHGQPAPFFIDQLLQSHTELSTALRLAGRKILRYEAEDDGSLEKIRKVLKRADHIRQGIREPAEPEQIAEATASVFGIDEPPGGQLSSDAGPGISIVESR